MFHSVIFFQGPEVGLFGGFSIAEKWSIDIDHCC